MSTSEWSVSGILRLCPADADVNSNGDRLHLDRMRASLQLPFIGIVSIRPSLLWPGRPVWPGRSDQRLPEVRPGTGRTGPAAPDCRMRPMMSGSLRATAVTTLVSRTNGAAAASLTGELLVHVRHHATDPAGIGLVASGLPQTVHQYLYGRSRQMRMMATDWNFAPRSRAIMGYQGGGDDGHANPGYPR
jgi:hypothetical protein